MFTLLHCLSIPSGRTTTHNSFHIFIPTHKILSALHDCLELFSSKQTAQNYFWNQNQSCFFWIFSGWTFVCYNTKLNCCYNTTCNRKKKSNFLNTHFYFKPDTLTSTTHPTISYWLILRLFYYKFFAFQPFILSSLLSTPSASLNAWVKPRVAKQTLC